MTFLQTSAAATLVGLVAIALAGRQRGEPVRVTLTMAGMALILALLVAHFTAVLAYPSPGPGDELGRLVSVFNGLASTGGFLGGALGAWLFARLTGRSAARMLDLMAVGVAVCWPLARTGCALVDDHPGARSSFFLAERFPDGLRHDLGLYEALAAVPILFAVLAVNGRRLREGALGADGAVVRAFLWLYAPTRFLLDFLRIGGEDARAAVRAGAIRAPEVDPRWLGLTLAQYVCLAVLLVLAATALRRQRAMSPPQTL